jgi:hypothetical protein
VAVKIAVIAAEFVAADHPILAALNSTHPFCQPPESTHVPVKRSNCFRPWHLAVVSSSEVQLRDHHFATTPRARTEQFLNYWRKCVLQLGKQLAELLRPAERAVFLPTKIWLRKLSATRFRTVLVIDSTTEASAQNQSFRFSVETVRVKCESLFEALLGCAVPPSQGTGCVLG